MVRSVNRGSATLLSGLWALGALVVACAVPHAATPSPEPTPIVDWTNPVFDQDFPDPYVLEIEGTYYAYATNGHGANVQVIRSPDLVGWERVEGHRDALPDLPNWSREYSGLTWAPSVLRRGERFVLYYVARYVDGGRQCISYALSDDPLGPFRDPNPAPFICPLMEGGAIDPEPFVDEDGSLYLLWKNDGNCCGWPVHLYAQRLSEDGTQIAGEPQKLIAYDQPWEEPLVENPSMVLHEGRYYLIYSANRYDDRTYAVGYAVCDGATGPCTKPREGPILASRGSEAGPGGASFFRVSASRAPEKQTWIAYHAWTEPAIGYPGGQRSLHLARVRFELGVPTFYRPEVRSQ
jgi:beta-xylosidase